MRHTATNKIIKLANRFEYKIKRRASVSDWIHTILDALGLIPGIGEIFDAANALYYAIEGDWLLAALSIISMIPEIGDAIGKGSKVALWLQKETPEVMKLAAKHGPKIKVAIKTSRELFLDNKKEIDEFLADVESGKKLPEFSKSPELKDKIGNLRKQLDKIEEVFEASKKISKNLPGSEDDVED